MKRAQRTNPVQSTARNAADEGGGVPDRPWLVVGGAGYIGSHIVRDLVQDGLDVVVLDDLSTGVSRRVPEGVAMVEGTVLDRALVLDVLRRYDISGVVHLAAKKAVGESWERPLYYYRQNVGGFACLLDAMAGAGIDRMVLSSSAAVYGMPDDPQVREDAPTRPLNPYGRSKLACEWMLSDEAIARPLHHITLRYFNAAGASSPQLGDDGAGNLIPMVFQALDNGARPQIFGDDYPTPDGTCVRDYVHIADVARAHVAAVRRLEEAAAGGGTGYAATFNLGRGVGASVKEVLAVIAEVTGVPFDAEVVARRPGDPAALVGAVEAIAADLGWRAERDLAAIVRDAWAAWRTCDSVTSRREPSPPSSSRARRRRTSAAPSPS